MNKSSVDRSRRELFQLVKGQLTKGQIAKAWEEFIDTGKISHESPRSVVMDSWKRSRNRGINPHAGRAQSVITSDELDMRLNRDDLGCVGKTVLDRISSTTDDTKHVVVLANSNSQIIYSVGQKQVQTELDNINFKPGGDWSVDEVGPNGVGTPIAINSPELIYGNEHYCQAWQPWACYGSPIHDSRGVVVGCIDITGPASDLSIETLSLAISLAHSVESGLSLIGLQRREDLRSVYQRRKSILKNDSTILIDNFGFILDINERFANLLGWNRQTLWISPLAHHDQGLWSMVKKRMSLTYTSEFEFHHPDNFCSMKLIIEPVYQSGSCLGAIIIVNNAIRYADSSKIFEPEDITTKEEHDLRTHSDQLIRDALEKSNGNISRAARILGINRTTIYRRLKLLRKL